MKSFLDFSAIQRYWTGLRKWDILALRLLWSWERSTMPFYFEKIKKVFRKRILSKFSLSFWFAVFSFTGAPWTKIMIKIKFKMNIDSITKGSLLLSKYIFQMISISAKSSENLEKKMPFEKDFLWNDLDNHH